MTVQIAQIKAARAMVGWTAQDLANASKVGVATIRRAESEGTLERMHEANKHALRMALEQAGIEFLSDGAAIGVMLRR